MTHSLPVKARKEKANRMADLFPPDLYPEKTSEFLIRKAYLHPDMIAVDLGAGADFLAAALSEKVSKVHVAADSADTQAEMRRRLTDCENIEIHKADASLLPFAAESVDVIFAGMPFSRLAEPEEAVRKMTRVLVPGGRLMIYGFEPPADPALTEDLQTQFTREDVHGWMEKAGLVNILAGRSGRKKPVADEVNGVGGSNRFFFMSGTKRLTGIRDLVREKYGALAITNGCCGAAPVGQGSCCDDSPPDASSSNCCSQPLISLESLQQGEIHFIQDYSPEEKSQAPVEAAGFSLGCGNPIAMAGLKPGEVVVDIGSGGGLDAFLAAKQVGDTGRVIGVDMTPEMLDRARASAERNGYTNVEFRRGDAADLPVDDGTVDVVMSNCVINLTEDKARVFAEAYRILKPGGRLEISDMVFSSSTGKAARAAVEGWSECVSGALIEEEMMDLVAQAGFTARKLRRSTSHGKAAGTSITSVILSAFKPE